MTEFEKWENEFSEFMAPPTNGVPEGLSRKIQSKVHGLLYPSTFKLFLSLLGVHLFAGTLTLFVCPQFGVGPIGGWLDLMEVVMPLGAVACAIFCGTLYLGATALATHFVFSGDMLRALERTRFKQFGMLAAVSVGAFMLASMPLSLPSLDVNFVLFWFLGGVLLSQWFFHLAFRFRGLNLSVAK